MVNMNELTLHKRCSKLKNWYFKMPNIFILPPLWGGNFWTSGFYANTVGQYGNKDVIRKYVENQGRKYMPVHSEQLRLW